MKGYFNNPELKRSSAALLFLMFVFLTCCYAIQTLSNENLKRDYIRVLSSVTAKVVEKEPQLEKEIIPLMTREVSKEEETRGKVILEQYGLTEKLDSTIFPYIKDNLWRGYLNLFLVGLVLSVLLFTLNYLQYGYFYEKMRVFNRAAKKIVDGDYNLKLSEEKEGDLSKLTKSFNSMGEVIRGTIFALHNEKRFLTDLLSDISHQLKTPLSSLILYNDILLNKELTKEQRESFLKNNQHVLNRMSWLILSLLKLAKIDADAIELEIEEQSLNETIEETVEILESKALEAKVNVEFIQEGTVLLKHDRLWLEEALTNVVKNGVEHAGEDGKVTVQLEDNPVFTRIVIHNTGEPICEEDMANIFKRFYKGKNTRKSDSIGIGLSLAKSVVERHGGYIEASSTPEKGTSFNITFLKY